MHDAVLAGHHQRQVAAVGGAQGRAQTSAASRSLAASWP